MSKVIADKIVTELGSIDDVKYKNLVSSFKGKFGYLPLFTNFLYRERISSVRVNDLLRLIINSNQVLRNHKVNPLDFKYFEELDDKVNEIIKHNNNLKFTKKFISNKYKFLVDTEVVTLFGDLKVHMDKESTKTGTSSYKLVQSYLINKIAGYDNIIDFKESINSLISSYEGNWDYETYKVKVEMGGGIIVDYINNIPKNILIAKIPNFKISNKIGNSNWCICRSKSYFSSYVSAEGVQYFIWDFNKDRGSRESMIGLSLTMSGDFNTSYDFFNMYVNERNLPLNINELRGLEKRDLLLNLPQHRYPINVINRIIKSGIVSKSDITDYDEYYFESNSSLMDMMSKGEVNEKDFNKTLINRRFSSGSKVNLDILDTETILSIVGNGFPLNQLPTSFFDKLRDDNKIHKLLRFSKNKLNSSDVLKVWLLKQDHTNEFISDIFKSITDINAVIIIDNIGDGIFIDNITNIFDNGDIKIDLFKFLHTHHGNIAFEEYKNTIEVIKGTDLYRYFIIKRLLCIHNGYSQWRYLTSTYDISEGEFKKMRQIYYNNSTKNIFTDFTFIADLDLDYTKVHEVIYVGDVHIKYVDNYSLSSEKEITNFLYVNLNTNKVFNPIVVGKYLNYERLKYLLENCELDKINVKLSLYELLNGDYDKYKKFCVGEMYKLGYKTFNGFSGDNIIDKKRRKELKKMLNELSIENV